MSIVVSLPSPESALSFARPTDEAPAYLMQDTLWIVLADRHETGGRWSMMEQALLKGAGPPPHKHLRSDETIFILQGTISILIGEKIETAGRGTFASIARNTRHAFHVDSASATILNGYTPASMDAMLAETGCRTTHQASRSMPSAHVPNQTPEHIAARYGLVWLDELDPFATRAHQQENDYE